MIEVTDTLGGPVGNPFSHTFIILVALLLFYKINVIINLKKN